MATVVSYNGISYTIPGVGDQNWFGTNAVDGFLISLANNSLQKTGGLFTLASDVDFGPTAGIITNYFKSRSSNIAQSGSFRLANGDSIAFRNHANSADLLFTVNSSDQMLFNGNQILTAGGALSASAAVVTDVSSNLISSSTSSTEIGYVHGVTSAIQTQLNAKVTYTPTQYGVVLSGSGITASVLTPDASTTKVLVSGGSSANPAWGQVALASAVSGTLPVGNGGTGQASNWNADGVIYASSTTAQASTAVGSAGQVLTSNGAGNAPAFATPPGNYYLSVYYPSSASNYWNTGSTTTIGTDLVVNGTIPSPSTYVNSNFGSISKATSSLPGINFSAPRTGVIRMTWTMTVYQAQNASTVSWGLQLVESTTSTIIGTTGASQTATSGNGSQVSVSITGFFPATASTTYNFKLQGYSTQANGDMAILSNSSSATAMLTMNMDYIT